jgi:hypothetical protein
MDRMEVQREDWRPGHLGLGRDRYSVDTCWGQGGNEHPP